MATLMTKMNCGLIRNKKEQINGGVNPNRIDALFVEVIARKKQFSEKQELNFFGSRFR